MATALNQYDRLESSELWRESPNAQRREVVVSLSRTALLVMDLNDNVLAHWHLHAINRLNPNRRPAIYSPGTTESETVEITDPHMIAAIEACNVGGGRTRGSGSRLRQRITYGCLAATVAALAYFGTTWLPGAVENQAVKVTPQVRIEAIDESLRAEIVGSNGPECDTQVATAVLGAMTGALALNTRVTASFVELGDRQSVHLPGGQILLDFSLLDDKNDPELAASFVLLEHAASSDRRQFRDLVRFAGTWHTIAFLLGKDLPAGVLRDFAPILVAQPPSPQNPEHLLKLFSNAGLSASPLAEAIGIDTPLGEALAAAEETAAQGSADGPIVDMKDWQELRQACAV